MPERHTDALFGDLDELGRATAEHAPLPFLFCVVSWGCAATQWLARTLNSRPDILCLHHADLFWERFAGTPPLDGWKYLRVIGVSGWSYTACGDVHGISLDAIPDLRAKLGDDFNCAILVREPLPRLRSQMALFETFPLKTAWNVGYVQEFIDQGVRLPQDTILNRLFLHGVNMLNRIMLEKPVAPIWRSEDLTSDPAMLARFVEELTRGKVRVEPEWAENAIRKRPSNRHFGPNAPAREFELWQIDALNKIVEPQAWRIYESLGYKVPDFVAPAHAG
jgi:hypothetical protein